MSVAEALEEAFAELRGRVTVEEVEGPSSHTVVRVTGLDSDAAVEALGRHLVGVIAGSTGTDARLAPEFVVATPDLRSSIKSTLEDRIGSSNELTDDFREDERDPWIAECIGHLLLALTRTERNACLVGAVAAARLPHVHPKRQGLDLLAIYEEDSEPGLCVGEGKASKSHASGHLTKAAHLFQEVDRRQRDLDIRMEVLSLKPALDADLRAKVIEGFWLERRAYVPLVAYESSFDPASPRPLLAGLAPDTTSKRLVSLHLPAYGEFFDRVSDAMRAALDHVLPDV